MAQRYYPVDLTLGNFPFISTDKSRTVMITGEGNLAGRNKIPNVLYGHNILPTDVGYESIGYSTRVPSTSIDTSTEYFTEVFIAYDLEGTKKYLAFTTLGNAYTLLPSAAEWVPVGNSITTGTFDVNKVSIGNVQSVSYICYAGEAVYTLTAANLFSEVTLTSIDISQVVTAIGASGYLILCTKDAVAWSSTIDPTDFTPSDITGAGGGNVADTAGDILFSSLSAYGFFIYTEGNVITATYTGNSNYPFKLSQLSNSSGGISFELTTHDSNYKYQFAYTKAGLQSVSYNAAETTLPEVTDFLSGKVIEDYSVSTNSFTQTEVAFIHKRLTLVASRYLIASYGDPSLPYYTHALVYDIALEKLGKLKADHVTVFEALLTQPEISKESIGLVSLDGTVRTVEPSVSATADGVIILGRLQYSHSRMFKLLGIELENLATGDNITVGSLPSFDGKNTTYVASNGSVSPVEDFVRTYNFMGTSKNVSIVINGRFNLTTALIIYALAGRR